MFYIRSNNARSRICYPTRERIEEALNTLQDHTDLFDDAEIVEETFPEPELAQFKATIKFEFSAPLIDNSPAHTAIMIQENYANGETILDKVQSVLDDAGAEYGDDAFKVKVKK